MFGIIGMSGLLIPAGLFLSAIASGCVVDFGRMHTRSSEAEVCVQTLDTPFMVLIFVLGFLLLGAALWVAADDRAERGLAGIGITIGFLASIVPIGWAIALVDYYGPYEGDIWAYLIGGLITILGASAALVLAAAWVRAPSDG